MPAYRRSSDLPRVDLESSHLAGENEPSSGGSNEPPPMLLIMFCLR
jgi:hypothetical protein